MGNNNGNDYAAQIAQMIQQNEADDPNRQPIPPLTAVSMKYWQNGIAFSIAFAIAGGIVVIIGALAAFTNAQNWSGATGPLIIALIFACIATSILMIAWRKSLDALGLQKDQIILDSTTRRNLLSNQVQILTDRERARIFEMYSARARNESPVLFRLNSAAKSERTLPPSFATAEQRNNAQIAKWMPTAGDLCWFVDECFRFDAEKKVKQRRGQGKRQWVNCGRFTPSGKEIHWDEYATIIEILESFGVMGGRKETDAGDWFYPDPNTIKSIIEKAVDAQEWQAQTG